MKRRRTVPPFLLIISLFVAAAVLYGAVRYSAVLQERTYAQRELVLTRALDRAVTNCYALEGSYPPDIAYLETHYGLSYDRDSFYIDYRPIASNLRPDYNVIPLKEGKER
ncbi:MAG: hypothetical protein J5935_05940 [Lachnospiraceae bacterium]|nr:hypothetical protein [Lachnospiraceae bacterium]